MIGARSSVLILLLASLSLAQDLPSQPDLDLPIIPEHYDPKNRAPGPIPKPDGDDARDEPPPVFFGEEIDAESDSIFYVIDFSCSMGRLDRDVKAKTEFARSVKALPPSFRFNVVVYSCQLSLWSPVMRKADTANKAEAVAFVEARHPHSGTGTGPAVGLALTTDRQNMSVVLLTDGAPNCGADGAAGHRAMIQNMNTQGATINVFGIDASGEWRAFCQDVAADSGGAYFDVP